MMARNCIVVGRCDFGDHCSGDCRRDSPGVGDGWNSSADGHGSCCVFGFVQRPVRPMFPAPTKA